MKYAINGTTGTLYGTTVAPSVQVVYCAGVSLALGKFENSLSSSKRLEESYQNGVLELLIRILAFWYSFGSHFCHQKFSKLLSHNLARLTVIYNIRVLVQTTAMSATKLILSSCWCLLGIATAGTLSKHVEILNRSGGKLQVDWIDPSTKMSVPFSAVYNGAHLNVDSYINHTFVVRQTKTETKESRIGYVTVTEDDNQGE